MKMGKGININTILFPYCIWKYTCSTIINDLQSIFCLKYLPDLEKAKKKLIELIKGRTKRNEQNFGHVNNMKFN